MGPQAGILMGSEAADRPAAMDALRQHLQRTIDRMTEKRAAFPGIFHSGKDLTQRLFALRQFSQNLSRLSCLVPGVKARMIPAPPFDLFNNEKSS